MCLRSLAQTAAQGGASQRALRLVITHLQAVYLCVLRAQGPRLREVVCSTLNSRRTATGSASERRWGAEQVMAASWFPRSQRKSPAS